MAKVFLESHENNYKVSNSDTLIYGHSANTTQTVELEQDVNRVVLDANIDGLQLPENQTSYQFVQAGNALYVSENDTKVARISIQDDSDGTQLIFADKKVVAKFVVGSNGVHFDVGGMIVDSSVTTLQETTPPKVLSFLPADNSLDVAVDSNLTFTFDEAIKTGSGSVIINGKSAVVIDITDKTQVLISEKTLTINPALNLKGGAFYSVQIPKGTIKDLANNDFAGINDTTTFNFKTQADKVTTGKAIDGYLSGATVFADENGDGIWNEGEAKAVTDAKGDFVLTGAKGTIVASGGIDLSTGKEFKGVLKAPEGSAVVTPLTTLQQGFVEQGKTVEEAHIEVAKILGFDSGALNLTSYDPILELSKTDSATPENKALAANLMASTLQIANFLVTAGQTLQGAAGDVNLSLHAVSDAVVKSLVTNLQETSKENKNVKLDLSDSSFLKTVLVGSAKEVGNLKDAQKVDLAKFTESVTKVSDSAVGLMQESAKSITAVVEKGGKAADLLQDLSKVSDYAQNQVGVALKQVTSNINSDKSNVKDALNNILNDFKQKEESSAPSSQVSGSTNVTTTPPVTQPSNETSSSSSGTSSGGSSSAPASPTFTMNLADGAVSWDPSVQGKVITFGGTATGNIHLSLSDSGVATFTRGGIAASTTVSDFYGTSPKKSILLNSNEVLELSPAQATALSPLLYQDYQLVRSNGGIALINTATITENTRLDGLLTPIEFHTNGVKQTTVTVDDNVSLQLGIGIHLDELTFVGGGNVSSYRGVGGGNHHYTILTLGRNNMNSDQDADVITTGNGTNEITGQQNADLITLSANGGTDTLIYRFSGTSYTPNNLSDSTTTKFDTVKNFQVGTDKIWLASEGHNSTVLVPESLTRFSDIDGTSITSQELLVSNVLKSQAFSNLAANAAGVIVVNGGDCAGTYLYINNTNAALEENADLFIKFENIQNLGSVGSLTPLNYFQGYFPNQNQSSGNSNSGSNDTPPAMQSIFTRDVNNNGALDAGDEIEFIFTEVVKASLLMNQNGSIVTNPVSQSGELVIMADGGATLGTNPTIRANGLSNGFSGSYTITLGSGTTMAAGGMIKVNLGYVEDITGNHPANDIQFVLPALGGSSSNTNNNSSGSSNIKSGSGTYSVQQFLASLNANAIATSDEIKIEDTPNNIQSGLSGLVTNVALIDSIRDAWYSGSVSLTKNQYQVLGSAFAQGNSPVVIVASDNDDFTEIRNSFYTPDGSSAYQIAIPDKTDLKLTVEQAQSSYTYNQLQEHNALKDFTNAGNVVISASKSNNFLNLLGLGLGDALEISSANFGIMVTAEQYNLIKMIDSNYDSIAYVYQNHSPVSMTANPDIVRHAIENNDDFEITLTSPDQEVSFYNHSSDYKNIVNTGNLTKLANVNGNDFGGVDILNIQQSLDMGVTRFYDTALNINLAENVEFNVPYPSLSLNLVSSISGSSNTNSKESIIFNLEMPKNVQIKDVEIVKILDPIMGQDTYSGKVYEVNMSFNCPTWLVYTNQSFLYGLATLSNRYRYGDTSEFVSKVSGFDQTKDRIVISNELTQDILYYSFNIGEAGAADTFQGAADFINANLDDFFWLGEDLEVGQDMYLAIADDNSWSVFRYLASANYSGGIDKSELSLVVSVDGALNEVGVFPVDVGIDYHAPKQEDFIGTDGNDNLIGNEVDNYIEGGAGNDTFQGLEGDDILVGSFDQSDTDTAVYSGVLSDYLIEKYEDPDWEKPFYFVTDLNLENGDEGWDILYSIETLKFSDTEISVEQAVLSDITPTDSSSTDFIGTDSDDVLVGNTLDNYIDGSLGDDSLTGENGNDILIGDSGIDVAIYRGKFSDYTITEDNSDPTLDFPLYFITDNNPSDGDDGQDLLYTVEVLRFSDVDYNLPVMSEYIDLFGFLFS